MPLYHQNKLPNKLIKKLQPNSQAVNIPHTTRSKSNHSENGFSSSRVLITVEKSLRYSMAVGNGVTAGPDTM